MTRRLLLATNNGGKLVELRRILDPIVDVELVGLGDVPAYDEPPETGATFADNALIKAREAALRTGLASVADDSGLTVAALNEMPGVLSARWSGSIGGRLRDDALNLALVLDQIADVPDVRRGGGFSCAAALVLPDGREWVEHGRLEGTIAREPRGSNGFGYDPIVVPLGETRTTAEMPSGEKDAISHRGRALRALAPHIAAALG